MTDHLSLIAPSRSQITQWYDDLNAAVFTKIFQAGADQELEACCKWIANDAEGHTGFDGEDGESLSNNLRSARRRTLLSLKQEGLDQLDSVQGLLTMKGLRSDAIRRALEALPND